MHRLSRSALSAVILALTGALEVYALNDWNVPCFQGQCSYDLPVEGATSGTLQIWGSSSGISDITPAAGWTVLDCNAGDMAQDIRLVCADGAPGCDHLFDGGAEGKIVRLPENCGKMPFARVARSWVSEDQSMPLMARAAPVQVRALSLDMKFAATSPTQFGTMSFAIQGSSAPGTTFDNGIPVGPLAQRRSHPRSWSPSIRMTHRRDVVTDTLLQKLSAATSFSNRTLTRTLPAIDINQPANLLQANQLCSANKFTPRPFEASVSVDVAAKVHAVVDVGVVATGTLVPPTLTEIGLLAGLNGNIDGILSMKANAAGLVNSGLLTLFQIGIPAVNFPGILTLGPEFIVQAQATVDLQLSLDSTIDLSIGINNVKMLFPPSQGRSTGSFTRGNTKLFIAASPNLSAQASFSAKLVPSVNIGIQALGGLAASVFLTMDTSTGLNLIPKASGSFRQGLGLVGVQTGSNVASAQVEGCITAEAALSVTAGARGTLKGLFDDKRVLNLFDQSFGLLDRCFLAASPAPAADASPNVLSDKTSPVSTTAHIKRAGLLCPAFPPPVALVNTIIPAPIVPPVAAPVADPIPVPIGAPAAAPARPPAVPVAAPAIV